MSGRPWSEEEVRALTEVYASAVYGGPLRLRELSKQIGRGEENVCRKARELGLTNKIRPKKTMKRGEQLTFFKDERFRKTFIGGTTRAYLAAMGHPRGMNGKKHNSETIAVVSAASRAMWADPKSKVNSKEASETRRQNIYKRIASGKWRSGGGWNRYTRGKGGKRADLGDIYFRSAWEANYARYLNFLLKNGAIRAWQYEPKTFCFEPIKRGTRFYTPDFLVTNEDGSREWHEVKGWMDAASKTRLKRMAKYHPNEKIRVIDHTWFKDAAKKLRGLIPLWE